jgi:hypothetical protein
MEEQSSDFVQPTDEQYLAHYEEIKSNPSGMFYPAATRESYGRNFETNTCPECRGSIKTENHGKLLDTDFMLCDERDCWTLSWISEKPLEASMYGITVKSKNALTKLQAAKLAFRLWKEAQAMIVEFPISVDEDIFPAIEDEGEGWFWVDYVPLIWNFNFVVDGWDREVIESINGMTFNERVEYLSEIAFGRLADYGWRDQESWLQERMSSKLTVEGCEFEISVGEFRDSSVRL